MRFRIDWASLIVGSKFTVFALFYFVLEGNFPSISPRGAYIWRGDLTEVFCVTGLGGLYLEGLVHGGGLFSEFYGRSAADHLYITTGFRSHTKKLNLRVLRSDRLIFLRFVESDSSYIAVLIYYC